MVLVHDFITGDVNKGGENKCYKRGGEEEIAYDSLYPNTLMAASAVEYAEAGFEPVTTRPSTLWKSANGVGGGTY